MRHFYCECGKRMQEVVVEKTPGTWLKCSRCKIADTYEENPTRFRKLDAADILNENGVPLTLSGVTLDKYFHPPHGREPANEMVCYDCGRSMNAKTNGFVCGYCWRPCCQQCMNTWHGDRIIDTAGDQFGQNHVCYLSMSNEEASRMLLPSDYPAIRIPATPRPIVGELIHAGRLRVPREIEVIEE